MKSLIVYLAIAAFFLAIYATYTLGTDISWCFENYSIDRLPHCMWFENSLTGQFFQP